MAFDIHIEGVANPQGARALTFGDYGRVLGVSGVQLMVNRFVKCFLTPKGTDISDLEYGTSLAAALGGNIDARFAEQLAATAVSEAEEKLREYDIANDMEPDSRLAKAQLQRIVLGESNSMVDVYVRLYSASGAVVDALMSSKIR